MNSPIKNIVAKNMSHGQNIVHAENLFFGTNEHERRLLWSALNLLETMVCLVDGSGALKWVGSSAFKFGSSLFNLSPLPQTLDELGSFFGVTDFGNKLRQCHNNYGIRLFKPDGAPFELREEVESGIITLRRIASGLQTDISNDKEAQALLVALDENRMCLFRQPIVDTKTGKIRQYECLARMLREDGTIARPIEFIPAAERAGLIARLDISALSLALEQLKANRDIKLAVNVSAATIADEIARQEFLERLTNDENHDGRLTIEITETIAIHDLDIAANFAGAVKDSNARIALDDFGAGYTSFRSLKILPLDEVKIDGNYVEAINERKDNQAFVKAINTLSHDLGSETIAARVETESEADILRKIGVSALQGYLFGRPQKD
jgi:EAL domain-containing protein (putative c-di-GMP-specific phosphodiesterase class I)